jgi:hypothetical protein
MVNPIYHFTRNLQSSQPKEDFLSQLLDNPDINSPVLGILKDMPVNFRIPYLMVLATYKIINFPYFQPFMVVITGPSGCGKTSLFDLFHSKKFFSVDVITPASFASHYAFAKKETLQKEIDLIPKIKSKIVFFKEMSSIFANYKKGREFLSIYTRILDGGPFTKTSGVHAPTTYNHTNHISFGAVTNVNRRIFRLISEIGPRMFFLKMGEGQKIPNFKELMDDLKNKTKEILKVTDRLPVKEIDEVNEKKIEKLAALLSTFRSLEPKSETPRRVDAIFNDIFRASESILSGSGLLLLKKLVRDSLPQERFNALLDLIQHTKLTGSYHFNGTQVFYSIKLRERMKKFLKESEVLNPSGNLANHWRWLCTPEFVRFWSE